MWIKIRNQPTLVNLWIRGVTFQNEAQSSPPMQNDSEKNLPLVTKSEKKIEVRFRFTKSQFERLNSAERWTKNPHISFFDGAKTIWPSENFNSASSDNGSHYSSSKSEEAV